MVHIATLVLAAGMILGLHFWLRKVSGKVQTIVPENPLLALFKQVIPFDYWYMYMIVPILAVYLCIVYLPQILRPKRSATGSK